MRIKPRSIPISLISSVIQEQSTVGSRKHVHIISLKYHDIYSKKLTEIILSELLYFIAEYHFVGYLGARESSL